MRISISRPRNGPEVAIATIPDSHWPPSRLTGVRTSTTRASGITARPDCDWPPGLKRRRIAFQKGVETVDQFIDGFVLSAESSKRDLSKVTRNQKWRRGKT